MVRHTSDTPRGAQYAPPRGRPTRNTDNPMSTSVSDVWSSGTMASYGLPSMTESAFRLPLLSAPSPTSSTLHRMHKPKAWTWRLQPASRIGPTGEWQPRLLLEEAIKIAGRRWIPTTADDRALQIGVPKPPTEDDEPDAPVCGVA